MFPSAVTVNPVRSWRRSGFSPGSPTRPTPISMRRSPICAGAGHIPACETRFIARRNSPPNGRKGWKPMISIPKIDRRRFIVTSFTVGGGFALGLIFPRTDAEAAAVASQIGAKPWEASSENSAAEINPWLVIAPDDTVTIRIAQSEMGQATFTSFAKMIVEELECDWSKVRTEYADVNRHFRESKVYGRMATNSSSSVRISRQYLQQAGASARERLMAAAAEQLGVPRSQLTVKDGVT